MESPHIWEIEMPTLTPEVYLHTDKIQEIEEKVNENNVRHAQIDLKFEMINDRLDEIKMCFSSIENRFDHLDNKISNITEVNQKNIDSIKALETEKNERVQRKEKICKIIGMVGLPILGAILTKFGEQIFTWLF